MCRSTIIYEVVALVDPQKMSRESLLKGSPFIVTLIRGSVDHLYPFTYELIGTPSDEPECTFITMSCLFRPCRGVSVGGAILSWLILT